MGKKYNQIKLKIVEVVGVEKYEKCTKDYVLGFLMFEKISSEAKYKLSIIDGIVKTGRFSWLNLNVLRTTLMRCTDWIRKASSKNGYLPGKTVTSPALTTPKSRASSLF